jgi:hypothetical protein
MYKVKLLFTDATKHNCEVFIETNEKGVSELNRLFDTCVELYSKNELFKLRSFQATKIIGT